MYYLLVIIHDIRLYIVTITEIGTMTTSIPTKFQFHKFQGFSIPKENFPYASLPEQKCIILRKSDNESDNAKLVKMIIS